MAIEYVILETGNDNNETEVVVHTATPIGNNDVGTSWVTCCVESLSPVVSKCPDSLLPQGRQVNLDQGDLFEWVLSVEYDANMTSVAKLLEIETQITAEEATELIEFQNRLRFWGKTATI